MSGGTARTRISGSNCSLRASKLLCVSEQDIAYSRDLSPSPPTLSPGTRVAAQDSGLTAEDLEFLQDFICPDELCQVSQF